MTFARLLRVVLGCFVGTSVYLEQLRSDLNSLPLALISPNPMTHSDRLVCFLFPVTWVADFGPGKSQYRRGEAGTPQSSMVQLRSKGENQNPECSLEKLEAFKCYFSPTSCPPCRSGGGIWRAGELRGGLLDRKSLTLVPNRYGTTLDLRCLWRSGFRTLSSSFPPHNFGVQ